MGFVMLVGKKVFSVETGFGLVVTKKGLEVGSKKVLHFEGLSDKSILDKSCDGVYLGLGLGLGVGMGVLGFQLISAQGSTK